MSEVLLMNIDKQNSFSVTEAESDFSKVLQTVDRTGSAVILKNNVPRYLIIEFSQAEMEAAASDEEILNISKQLMKKNHIAYEELAK